jgi:hypothetical protein
VNALLLLLLPQPMLNRDNARSDPTAAIPRIFIHLLHAWDVRFILRFHDNPIAGQGL